MSIARFRANKRRGIKKPVTTKCPDGQEMLNGVCSNINANIKDIGPYFTHPSTDPDYPLPHRQIADGLNSLWDRLNHEPESRTDRSCTNQYLAYYFTGNPSMLFPNWDSGDYTWNPWYVDCDILLSTAEAGVTCELIEDLSSGANGYTYIQWNLDPSWLIYPSIDYIYNTVCMGSPISYCTKNPDFPFGICLGSTSELGTSCDVFNNVGDPHPELVNDVPITYYHCDLAGGDCHRTNCELYSHGLHFDPLYEIISEEDWPYYGGHEYRIPHWYGSAYGPEFDYTYGDIRDMCNEGIAAGACLEWIDSSNWTDTESDLCHWDCTGCDCDGNIIEYLSLSELCPECEVQGEFVDSYLSPPGIDVIGYIVLPDDTYTLPDEYDQGIAAGWKLRIRGTEGCWDGDHSFFGYGFYNGHYELIFEAPMGAYVPESQQIDCAGKTGTWEILSEGSGCNDDGLLPWSVVKNEWAPTYLPGDPEGPYKYDSYPPANNLQIGHDGIDGCEYDPKTAFTNMSNINGEWIRIYGIDTGDTLSYPQYGTIGVNVTLKTIRGALGTMPMTHWAGEIVELWQFEDVPPYLDEEGWERFPGRHAKMYTTRLHQNMNHQNGLESDSPWCSVADQDLHSPDPNRGLISLYGPQCYPTNTYCLFWPEEWDTWCTHPFVDLPYTNTGCAEGSQALINNMSCYDHTRIDCSGCGPNDTYHDFGSRDCWEINPFGAFNYWHDVKSEYWGSDEPMQWNFYDALQIGPYTSNGLWTGILDNFHNTEYNELKLLWRWDIDCVPTCVATDWYTYNMYANTCENQSEGNLGDDCIGAMWNGWEWLASTLPYCQVNAPPGHRLGPPLLYLWIGTGGGREVSTPGTWDPIDQPLDPVQQGTQQRKGGLVKKHRNGRK